MNLENRKLSDVRLSIVWDEFQRDLLKLNELSTEMVNGFHQDFRGVASLIAYPSINELDHDSNPIEKMIIWWTNHKPSVTLFDLQTILMKLNRIDIYEAIAKAIDKHQCSTDTASRPVQTVIVSDDEMITNQDVNSMEERKCVMAYDAFLLYADNDDDDEQFAFDIKSVMEKRYYFKICTRRDLLLGTSFEHDAIMRMLDQKRCDKLIVVLSKSFCHQNHEIQDDLARFIVKFAQSLQIHDNRKIIPCARDNSGIAYNLKGYSVLNSYRSGRLFSFWDRLANIMENGRVSVDQRVVIDEIIKKNELAKMMPSAPNDGHNQSSLMSNILFNNKSKTKKEKKKLNEELMELL